MIKQVRITNFRSLRDVTVDLDPLTVLIGRSGTGKSNFVNALRFLRNLLKTRNRDSTINEFGGVASLLPVGLPNDVETSFELTFDTPRAAEEYRYFLGIRFVSAKLHGSKNVESLAVGAKTFFSRRDGKWEVTPAMANPPPPAELAPLLGRFYGIPQDKLAYLALTNGMGCYDFPSDVMQRGEYRAQDETAMTDDGRNYRRVIEAISDNLNLYEEWLELMAGVRKINSTALTLQLDVMNLNRVLVGHSRAGDAAFTLPLADESEGFRRFLAHLLCLYQVPAKSTLIFEEPEKGIYPGALATLADFFKSHTAAGRSQIILTTHNPVLLDHFPADSIRVVDIEGSATRIGRLSPEQFQAVKESLLTTGELLTVDPARTEGAPSGT